ncbi:CAP domain-containing protein [Jiella sp. M17.18]|uniref:CAP domain-containing protein n=1 Tax=Jiella sp. M17.18 TaxID=3234247 RepID=UPI0034DE92D5
MAPVRRLVPLLMAAVVLAGATSGAGAQAVKTGDLAQLRQRALELVNKVRSAHGLSKLTLDDRLNAIAQAHSADMLKKHYFAHVAPNGESPRDRFLAHGGSRWKLVAENIAKCTGCDVPPDIHRVEAFQTGWMHSPEHRRNILTKGLEHFGFGIAGANGTVYADQDFSGPGTPHGTRPDETPKPVPAKNRSERMAKSLAAERKQAGVPPLKADAALTKAARNILGQSADGRLPGGSVDLLAALPQDARGRWSSLRLLSAACGGCGTTITDADIRSFRKQWMDNPQFSKILSDGSVRDIGVAMDASGSGRKTAIAVLGVPR